jgi:hypothetical protein
MSPGAASKTGLLGPVALSGGILLLLASPIMRGGNRYLALVPLELLGLLVVAAVWVRWSLMRPPAQDRPHRWPLLLLLAMSPLVLALVQLTPLPPHVWTALPGHGIYQALLDGVGVPTDGPRALSLGPAATAASLLAGIPIAATLLLGFLATLGQLRLLLAVVVAMAFAQVLLGLLQIAGGEHSPFFFGVMTFGPPVGSFANRNHYANYLAMALAGFIWLAFESLRERHAHSAMTTFTTRHRTAIWCAGGAVLVLGILMSRSRGGALFGLLMAATALVAVSLRLSGTSRGSKLALGLLALVLLGAGALLGSEALTSRVSLEQLASSAGFRTGLARTSLEGALAFWPWGSGWGTYDMVYPRFQPLSLPGFANHAHMDYIEMLFEGGALFVGLAGAFAWLASRRIFDLIKLARGGRALDRDAMASLLCGLGLLTLLLHSLVEFNMRIPANAILGALLAGAFLRPLNTNVRPRFRRSAFADSEVTA